MKICSLYGVGFYYIPGTDMCIKIGGWMRAQYDYGMNGSTTTGGLDGNVNTRATNNSVWRMRGYVTADARNQTPYGTVRAYLDVGFATTDVGSPDIMGLNANRGFIQWAGFTFGQAVSFFDFYSIAATSYLPAFPASSTGGGGWGVAGYTAQFGNGFSGTIAAEMRRQGQIIGDAGAAGAAVAIGTLAPGNFAQGGGYGGFQAPDIVGNLRVDQAWGSAQLMGAIHQVNSTYYTAAAPFANLAAGHPGDTWGWAIGGGLKLNAPMIGKGDYLQVQTQYTEGASGYTFSPQVSDFNYYKRDGASAGYGILSDAVFGGTVAAGTNSGLNLTTTWGVNAAFEHHWNDQWKTSLVGGYAETSYNAQANAILCSAEPGLGGGANGVGAGTAAVATAGCNNDWNVWWISSRTQWNVTKDFYMGVDVLYSSLQSASTFNGVLPVSQSNGTTATTVSDVDNLAVEFRVHKDFYP